MKNAMQLKAILKNMAKQKNISACLLYTSDAADE